MASLKRFADTSTEEIEAKRINIEAKNTVKANAKCSRILRAYLVEKQKPSEFETFDEAELSEALSHFYVDARKPDGEQYKAGSLEAIRHGLNRYLKAPPFSKSFDIIKDAAFHRANRNYKAAMVALRKAGLGDTAHHPHIDEADRVKLYTSPYMSTDNPCGLLNKVQFDIRIYLCRRGADNMRSFSKSTFVVATDPKTGLKFVAWNQGGKNIHPQTADKRLSVYIMPQCPGSPYCPVASFEAYLAKLNPGCDSLWQRPYARFSHDDPVWYYNVPVGEKTLASFMTQLSVAAKLSKVYSNHSIRTTGGILLAKEAVGAAQVITITGHRPVLFLTACEKVDKDKKLRLHVRPVPDHQQIPRVQQKHFVEGRPTEDHPDPVSANPEDQHAPPPVPASQPVEDMETKPSEKEIQSGILSNFDILALAAENRKGSIKDESLQSCEGVEKSDMKAEIDRLREEIAKVCLEKEDLQRTVEFLQEELRAKQVPNINYFRYLTMKLEDFEYYTGYSHESFYRLSKFLIPTDEAPFEPSKPLSCLSELTFQDQLLLVLMKLRQDFEFKHLATLFGIFLQDSVCVFNSWVNYMFFRFGSLPSSIWPHRDTIIENMPSEFKEDFPRTVSIIDVIEVKIQRPRMFRTESQSQFFSEKSSATLKGIIGVDPRGAVTFVSMLHYSTSTSKELMKHCGYYQILKLLMQAGKVKEGDSVMVGKDLPIEKELQSLGLKLESRPVTCSNGKMSESDVTQMNKIAKHHVHVERAITRIKQFKILSSRSSLGHFKSFNQIWRVCCLLTNFMPFLENND